MDRQLVVVEADLERADHQAVVLALTAAYAADPMGVGDPLPSEVRERVIPGLKATPNARVFLAYLGGEAVGLATCFIGFSTFHARPLINIHDLAVLEGTRGRGIGRALLTAVEAEGRVLGCCKVTLEVNERNQRAMQLYQSAGFKQAGADGPVGGALFFSKALE
jgi:ribosomal protein S18 acetylase RimI-like enzyme